jgi:hypothetical protein
LENGKEFLSGTVEGDFASYKYLVFGGETSFSVTGRGQGEISLYVDRPYGDPLGVVPIDSQGHWAERAIRIPPLSGVHSIHLSLSKPSIDLLSFRFHA